VSERNRRSAGLRIGHSDVTGDSDVVPAEFVLDAIRRTQSKCGSLGAEIIDFFTFKSKLKPWIHKTEFCGCQNWVQMESC
jgi:hypothetical protein